MNVRVWVFILGLVVGATQASGADLGIEFSGVLGGGSDVRVALTDKSSGATKWLPVGARFAGYTIASYDPKTDVLVLTRDGQQHRLGLRQAKAVKGGQQAPPEIARAITNNLRQLAAAADQFYLEHGKNSTTYDDLVGPQKYVKSLQPVDGENYRALQFAQGKPLTVTTASGYTISYEP